MDRGLQDVSLEKLKKLKSLPSVFVEEVIGVEPFDYQKGVLDSNESRIAFVSGRQVGKSRTAAWIGLHHAVTNAENTVLITAPTQDQASQLFRQVKKEMQQSQIPDDLWGTDRETRRDIEFEHGSRILCRPANDNLRGLTTSLIIADEAAKIDDEIFYQVLLPMLATTDGDFILASTPHGTQGFLFDAFHNELEADYFKKQVPTYRNPTVSEEYIAQQQQQLSSLEFKQEILGKFVESADSFFTTDQIDGAIEEDDTVPKSSDRAFLGVDIARHGEDDSVYIAMDSNANVFICESDSDTDLTHSIGRIKNLHETLRFSKIYIDETALGGGVVDILKDDLMRGTVEGITFTNKKKRSLYNTLKQKIESGEITLPNHGQLRKQLLDLEYEFTKNGKMNIHAPQGGHDDFCDALTLAAWGQEKSSKERQSGPATL